MSEARAGQPIVAPPPLSTGPKYGLDRFHSPRRYTCAHDGCSGPAATLARAGAHDVGDGNTRTHNCCGGDHAPPTSQPQPETKD